MTAARPLRHMARIAFPTFQFSRFTGAERRGRLSFWFALALLAVGTAGARPAELAGSENHLVQGPCPHLVCGAFPLREQDEVWLIDTHGLPDCRTQPIRMRVERHTPKQSETLDIQTFLDAVNSETDHLTLLFVHGYKTNLYWACNRGELTYRQVTQHCVNEQPLRFVIWAWPSEQEYGPIRDIRDKANRADREGEHLGWVLQRMVTPREIALIGYSLGARIVLGGVQRVAREGFVLPEPPLAKPGDVSSAQPSVHASLALESECEASLNPQPTGADMDGEVRELLKTVSTRRNCSGNQAAWHVLKEQVASDQLPEQAGPTLEQLPESAAEAANVREWPQPPRFRVALVAAALDREWLLPCRKFGMSYQLMESLLLITNHRDRAMRVYGLVDRGRRVIALGKEGIGNLFQLPDGGAKVDQIDVARVVGTQHSIARYFASWTVIEHLREALFPCEPSPR